MLPGSCLCHLGGGLDRPWQAPVLTCQRARRARGGGGGGGEKLPDLCQNCRFNGRWIWILSALVWPFGARVSDGETGSRPAHPPYGASSDGRGKGERNRARVHSTCLSIKSPPPPPPKAKTPPGPLQLFPAEAGSHRVSGGAGSVA